MRQCRDGISVARKQNARDTKLPDMKERLASEGFDIDDSPPEVFQRVLKRDVAK